MIKAYLEGLQPRERNLVLLGAAVIVLAILYLVLWQPYSDARRQALREGIEKQRSELAWMQGAAEQVKRLRAASGVGGAPADGSGQSLLALVDQTAKQQQLGSAVKRIEPAGQHSARIWLEGAEFDILITWLDSLARGHAVSIQTITLDRAQAGPGRVNARITLDGGGA